MNSSNSTAVRDRSQAANDLGSDGVTAGPCVAVVASSTREWQAAIPNAVGLGGFAVRARRDDESARWWRGATLRLLLSSFGEPKEWPMEIKEGVRRGVRVGMVLAARAARADRTVTVAAA